MAAAANNLQSREVVHILVRSGVNGGSYWDLLLDCGHENTAHFHRKLGYGFTSIRSAPRRMQCILGCVQPADTTTLHNQIWQREKIAASNREGETDG